MNLKLPSRFVMLDKAIATLASVGQEVYPEFNVFEVAKPYARDCSPIASTRAPRRSVPASRRSGSLDRARHARTRSRDILEQLREGTFQVHIENPGIDEIDDHIDKATNRIAVALVILGGLLGSAMIGVFAKTGRTPWASTCSRSSASSSRASSGSGSSGGSSGTGGSRARPSDVRPTVEERL